MLGQAVFGQEGLPLHSRRLVTDPSQHLSRCRSWVARRVALLHDAPRVSGGSFVRFHGSVCACDGKGTPRNRRRFVPGQDENRTVPNSVHQIAGCQFQISNLYMASNCCRLSRCALRSGE